MQKYGILYSNNADSHRKNNKLNTCSIFLEITWTIGRLLCLLLSHYNRSLSTAVQYCVLVTNYCLTDDDCIWKPVLAPIFPFSVSPLSIWEMTKTHSQQ